MTGRVPARSDAFLRHAALPAAVRRRIERSLSPEERRQLKAWMQAHQATVSLERQTPRARLLARHGPRVARMLTDLLDGELKVRSDALAPAARAALQAWIDSEVSNQDQTARPAGPFAQLNGWLAARLSSVRQLWQGPGEPT